MAVYANLDHNGFSRDQPKGEIPVHLHGCMEISAHYAREKGALEYETPPFPHRDAVQAAHISAIQPRPLLMTPLAATGHTVISDVHLANIFQEAQARCELGPGGSNQPPLSAFRTGICHARPPANCARRAPARGCVSTGRLTGVRSSKSISP